MLQDKILDVLTSYLNWHVKSRKDPSTKGSLYFQPSLYKKSLSNPSELLLIQKTSFSILVGLNQGVSMKKEYLFDKVSELKEKFKSFFQHRKKIAALENYSTAGKFSHKNYLTLVKACMNDGFLGNNESDFLDYMLSRYELNYLDWAHRTKWLKNEIAQKQAANEAHKPFQAFFNFEQQGSSINIPLGIMNASAKQISKRI